MKLFFFLAQGLCISNNFTSTLKDRSLLFKKVTNLLFKKSLIATNEMLFKCCSKKSLIINEIQVWSICLSAGFFVQVNESPLAQAATKNSNNKQPAAYIWHSPSLEEWRFLPRRTHAAPAVQSRHVRVARPCPGGVQWRSRRPRERRHAPALARPGAESRAGAGSVQRLGASAGL